MNFLFAGRSSDRAQRGRLEGARRPPLLLVVVVSGLVTVSALAGRLPLFLDRFTAVTRLASTVPANGDVNPYGVAIVPKTVGALVQGDTLVSNFNASSNLQGTGTTIVEISPSGQQTLFADLSGPLPGKCPGGVGLTTALTVLSGGFVVVGSLPVTDDGQGTPETGCLIVLNSVGAPVETWSGHHINGPWDLMSFQLPGFAELFVTNVLNGTVAAAGAEVKRGTVVRIEVVDVTHGPPRLVASQLVGSGFAEELDTSALVVGPTGLALGHDGTLYVADTVSSRLAKIPSAVSRATALGHGGVTLTSGGSIDGPLGLTLAPKGPRLRERGRRERRRDDPGGTTGRHREARSGRFGG
jgi:hypothetical protein